MLVGERYGWVPPEERMKVAVREAGFTGDVAGKSVTALEIEFGALSSPDQLSRTWFYFRDPLPHGDLPEDLANQYREADPGAAQRLDSLKQRITSEHPDRVRHYRLEWDSEEGGFKKEGKAGLAAFGQQVLKDLWSDLDPETKSSGHQSDPTWQHEERWELETFVEDRGRGFLGRVETVRELRALVLSPLSEGGSVGCFGNGTGGIGQEQSDRASLSNTS